jgi:nitrile hydratase beta subunit
MAGAHTPHPLSRNLPHDLGGQTGHRYDFGAVQADEPVFAETWHGRALAITIAAAAHGKWNLDASRHARELLPPEDYARFSYYDKWLSALANLLVAHGLVTTDELASAAASQTAPPLPASLTARTARKLIGSGGPTQRPLASPPQFETGQSVRTKTPAETAHISGGHTRLPAYAALKTGIITACHGGHILPDSHAHFKGEAPEPLYTVSFRASDLFATANARDEVRLDLWQSYLEPAAQ